MAVAQVDEPPTFGLVFGNLEHVVEGRVGRQDPQPIVEHHDRTRDRLDDAVRVVASLLGSGDAALQVVDIGHQHHRAIDAPVDRQIGPDLKAEPAPVSALHLGLLHGHAVDYAGDLGVEILDLQVGLDVVDRPADVGRAEVHQVDRFGCESANAPRSHRRSRPADRCC